MTQIHCSLCTFPFPTQEIKKIQKICVIVLDMDGVFIWRMFSDEARKISNTVKELFEPDDQGNFTGLQWRIAASRHLYPDCLKSFRSLVEKIEKAKYSVFILLSSSWRTAGTLKEIREQIFAPHFFCQKIVGKTPPRSDDKEDPDIKQGIFYEQIAKEKYGFDLQTRVDQIKFWFKEHKQFLGKIKALILDDEDLSSGFSKSFVHVPSCLRDKEVEKALQILGIQNQKIEKKKEEKPRWRN